MTQIFLQVLNGSLAVFWVVLGILLLRLLLRKTPKWIHCLLWSIAALRLLIPVSIQSNFSLLPSAQVLPTDITITATPAIYSGIPTVDGAVNPLFTAELAPQTNALPQLLNCAGWIWLAGVAVMLLISAISWLRLRLRLRISLPLGNRVYLCDCIDSPFVFGILIPKIYLPSSLEEAQRPFVLAHEQAHIRRRDHWWKPLGYLLLSAHWFNPLLWVSYILLCRDIEQACDDKVVRAMSSAEKKGYSEALLSCSLRNRLITVCPVAFGEVGVKTRIRGVLNYKKPAFWVLIASSVAVAVAALCFLTDPFPCNHSYEAATLRAPTCTQTGVQTQTCTDCGHSYTEPLPLSAHTYDNGVVIVASTCTQTGKLQRNCIDCNEAVEEALPLVSHNLGPPYYTVEANCTEEGSKSATCTMCKAQFVTQILPTNNLHNLTETVVKVSTCTEQGESLSTCSRCNYEKKIAHDKTAHTLMRNVRQAPTCCVSGREAIYCTECDFVMYETLDRYPHSYLNGICRYCHMPENTKPPSPAANGTSGTLSTFVHTHTTPQEPAIKRFVPSQ